MVHRPSTRKMSLEHEKYLAVLFNGERQRNSGAIWNHQADIRNHRDVGEFGFAVDGKSTFSKSIGISEEMWDKIVEQSHDLRPALALRWYSSWHLDVALDLVVISADDFQSLLTNVRREQ